MQNGKRYFQSKIFIQQDREIHLLFLEEKNSKSRKNVVQLFEGLYYILLKNAKPKPLNAREAKHIISTDCQRDAT